ncbi:MAG: hypothetical protein J6T65_06720 [Clostridia bacterium]|nr:hypothetical protein [Clostridia bacterium]
MTVHCLGNGKVCVYGRGADVFQAFGPEYSSPDAFTLSVFPEGGVNEPAATVKHSRVCFSHTLGSLKMLDLVPPGSSAFYRAVTGNVRFRLTLKNAPVLDLLSPGTAMAVTEPGAIVYATSFESGRPHGYTSNRFRYILIKTDGDVVLRKTSDTELEIAVSGRGLLSVVFSETPEGLFSERPDPEIGNLMFSYLESPPDASPLKHDPRLNPARNLPAAANSPFYKEILDGADVICAQQAETGAVLAGYNYHLSYVRDNYGVFRFFLAAGAYENARRLLAFYTSVFERHGRIQNAQGMSESAFHIHENDRVEITGYLVLMFTAYLRATGDTETVRKALPLIKYCLLSQQAELSTCGTLPFNGDETYIAGGLLPRSAIADGSMEATALFHRAITEALSVPFIKEYLGAGAADLLEAAKALIENRFTANFAGENGLFYSNRPLEDHSEAPLFRPGGVRACGHGFGLSFRNKNGDYVCPACLSLDLPPLFPGLYGKRFAVEAALLSPCFTGSQGLIPEGLTAKAAASVRESLNSRSRIVGFEYGFLMYGQGFDRGLAELMLAQRDRFGAWSEYYDGGNQAGTLCRPWETAVNLAALIEKYPEE